MRAAATARTASTSVLATAAAAALGEAGNSPSAERPAAEPKKAPPVLYVLDTTATPGEPKRTHELLIDGAIKSFEFTTGQPKALPPAIALRFLKIESFKLTDEAGDIQPFRRRPKQPDELEAGETLVLADDMTVARYEELSTAALQHRVMEMPGSEKFVEKPSRAEMIDFIVAAKLKTRAANKSRERDVKPDEFVPEFEPDDDE